MGTVASLFVVLFAGVAVFTAHQNRFEGYNFGYEAYVQNNPAVLARFCGFMAALFIAAASAYQPYDSVLATMTNIVMVITFALVALVASQYVNDHLILRNVRNTDEVVGKRNLAVAIVEMSTYLATALIFAGGTHDASHGFWFNALWFIIGQAFMIGAVQLFATLALAPGGIGAPVFYKKIEGGNAACAVSLAGFVLSGGIVIGSMLSKQPTTFGEDLKWIALALVGWLVLMALTRMAVMAITWFTSLRLAWFPDELGKDNNWAAGLFDGVMFVAITAAFISVVG